MAQGGGVKPGVMTAKAMPARALKHIYMQKKNTGTAQQFCPENQGSKI